MREKWHALKHLIYTYYVFVAIGLGLFFYLQLADESMDMMIQISLIVFLLGFPIVFFYTLRYALHIFLFSLAFISGFYGFYHHSVDNHSISNALYFTFRLYLLDFADVFTPDGSSPVQYPFLLEVARWSAASYTISTIFIAMYRTLEKQIMLFAAQTLGNHHIIFSYNEKSHILIESLKEQGERVIVIDDRFDPEVENMLEEMKVIVIQASLKDTDIFKQAGVKKAASISLFHESDQDSLYILMTLESYIKQHRIQIAIHKVLVHLTDERYKAELLSFLEKVEHFSFDVQVINAYEEVARLFWDKHKELFTEDLRLLVVGYELLGRQLVHRAIERYEQELLDSSLHITILDKFIDEEEAQMIRKIPFDIQHESLKAVIDRNETSFTHIFICLDEDYVDLMEGIELSEVFPETPIYMNFTDETIEQTFMIATTETKKSLYSTGIIQDVLTKEYLGL